VQPWQPVSRFTRGHTGHCSMGVSCALFACATFTVCSVFLVFEYLEHDMGRLLDTMPRPFTLSEVKCLVQQVRVKRNCRRAAFGLCWSCFCSLAAAAESTAGLTR
jgi:hypothetical protein